MYYNIPEFAQNKHKDAMMSNSLQKSDYLLLPPYSLINKGKKHTKKQRIYY